ncbi:uncharacterized protein [Medicago truncatula]|uniref:uncharacterized protein n=1 Tax=Medicago truncatula TaxID=3880 RepID=UPI000D2F2B3D|nr:uncharacterized protein LOC112422874 [Medicago truncatula]
MEEEGEVITVEDDVTVEGEAFGRTLVGKIWTDVPYNIRAFKQTMIQAWRLKNTVEIQDLNKNLFLFKFVSRRDAENILHSGPWSFDRNLLILDTISSEEQPSELDLHTVQFWVRIYDLPLKLRSDLMARKLGDLVGKFLEVDQRDTNIMGKSIRIKVDIDLRNPLKRGIVLKYQKRSLWIFFKYERLPNFCYKCGRIGHQMKECEEETGQDGEGYTDVEEQDQAYGSWMRASPLPKFQVEFKKEPSTGTCSKSLFSSTSSSKGSEAGEEKTSKVLAVNEEETPMITKQKDVVVVSPEATSKAIEGVAETLGSVSISQKFAAGVEGKKEETQVRKKWNRQKGPKGQKPKAQTKGKKEGGKRQISEANVTDSVLEAVGGVEKKRHLAAMEIDINKSEEVLDDQHLLPK